MKAVFTRRTRKGQAVLLGEGGHCLAAYHCDGPRVSLENIETVDTRNLRDVCRRPPGVSASFQPRSVYADIGEFSSVSPEATAAQIRSHLDRTGLFKDDYRISFVKMDGLDEHRARYSYLAVAVSDVNSIAQADEENAFVRVLCPMEASLARAIAAFDDSMTLVVAQDQHFIRLIASQRGIIHYLITINARESFDAVSDTVSGIREISSLLANIHREKIRAVYMIGAGEVTPQDLLQHSIDTEDLPRALCHESGLVYASLYGTALGPAYDFTTDTLKATRRLVSLARISAYASTVMLIAACILVAAGLSCATRARELSQAYRAASIQASREIDDIRKVYEEVSSVVDLTDINALVQAYRDFQAQPRLHAVVGDVSRIVGDGVYLTKIELDRQRTTPGAETPRVDPRLTPPEKTTRAESFGCTIEGVINAPYPASKEVFSSLLASMNGLYRVRTATFAHEQSIGRFAMECTIRP